MALIVSGGHTELVYMKDHLQFQVIGETRDDAVEEPTIKLLEQLDYLIQGTAC